VRGYLGNSARTRSKTNNRGKSGDGQQGQSNKKPRRRRSQNSGGGGGGETGNFTEDDIVSKAELEGAGKLHYLNELKNMPAAELVAMAESVGLENLARSRKQDIIFEVLKAYGAQGEAIYGDGTLEILQDGFGFLRSADSSFLAGPDDIYVSPSQIRRFNLRTGDTVGGLIRPPKDGERYFALLKVAEINLDEPENARRKVK